MAFISMMNNKIWSTVALSVNSGVLGMGKWHMHILAAYYSQFFCWRGFREESRPCKGHEGIYIFPLPLMLTCFATRSDTEHSKWSFHCTRLYLSLQFASKWGRRECTWTKALEEKSSLLKMSWHFWCFRTTDQTFDQKNCLDRLTVRQRVTQVYPFHICPTFPLLLLYNFPSFSLLWRKKTFSLFLPTYYLIPWWWSLLGGWGNLGSPIGTYRCSSFAFSGRKTCLHLVKCIQNPTWWIQACSFNSRFHSYKEIVSCSAC